MPRADRLYAVSVMDYGALDLLGKKAATLLAQFTDVVLIAFPHAGVTRLAPNIGNDVHYLLHVSATGGAFAALDR